MPWNPVGSGLALDPGFYGEEMISNPIGAAWRPYLRVLADTALDAASIGAWIAAAELPPMRRRLARGGLAAVTAAVAIPGFRAARASDDSTGPAAPSTGSELPFVEAGIKLPVDEPSDADTSMHRRAVLVGAVGVAALTTAVAVSVGGAAAGRQLERRWLARLTRHGHPHPHRALAVRIASLYAVMVVPGRVLAVRKDAEAASRDAEPVAGDGNGNGDGVPM